MCGIVGWINKNPDEPVNERVLHEMNETLYFRGPDSAGLFAAANIGLAQRRLCIVDLSERGRQPFFSEDGSIAAVCNGEIYNYPELKERLVACGHEFTGGSDCESVVHAYEEWGEDCLAHLDGMFALAVYDRKRHRVLLAVDRFGKKPLYYAETATAVLFASEPKAFYPHPGFRKQIDTWSVVKYLSHDSIPAPRTIYRDCFKLPRSTFLSIDTKRPVLTAPAAYWRLSYEPKHDVSEAGACERVRELLRRAVSKRLMSDVPLGLFLSGGIDSTVLLTVMKDLDPARRVKTFTVAFSETSFDESAYARRVAEFFGSEHHERSFSPREMIDTLPGVIESLDEPFADPSILPVSLICAFARKTVTVALGGDGGDEVFAGYDPFAAHRIMQFARFLPQWPFGLLKNSYRLLPRSDKNLSLRFKARHFLQGLSPQAFRHVELRNSAWMSAFAPEDFKLLFADPDAAYSDWQRVFSETLDYARETDARHWIDRAIDSTINIYMNSDILYKVDRAGMRNSLEVRSPFLDRELVEYVSRLPVGMKMKGGARKYILKKIFADRIPPEILTRPKKGFGVPLAAWMRGPLAGMVREMLAPARIKKEGLFNHEYVARLVDEHLSGRGEHVKDLWALFMFEYWRELKGI